VLSTLYKDLNKRKPKPPQETPAKGPVLKYEILTHCDIILLENQVTAKLQAGWRLAGGVCVAYDPTVCRNYYYQAIYQTP
jgi:hypothetical protein